jgi:hypothetical protein
VRSELADHLFTKPIPMNEFQMRCLRHDWSNDSIAFGHIIGSNIGVALDALQHPLAVTRCEFQQEVL